MWSNQSGWSNGGWGRAAIAAVTSLFSSIDDLTFGGWIKPGGVGILADQAASPSTGLTTADLLYASSTVSYTGITQGIAITSGATYEFGFDAKASGFNYMAFTSGGAFGFVNGWFNVSTGTVGTNNSAGATITSLGGGWYRVRWRAIAAQTTTACPTMQLADGDNNPSATASGTNGVLLSNMWAAAL